MMRKASLFPIPAVAALVALSACRSEEPRTPGAADSQPPLATDLGAANNAAAPTSDAVAMGTPMPRPTCPAPKDLGVRLIGRYDGCSPAGPRSSWSGSGFVAHFLGTGLDVTLTGPPVTFTTIVDGSVRSEFTTRAGKGTYSVVSALHPGEHVVQIARQGEASFGATVLEEVKPKDGTLLAPPPPLPRRLEFVGDSITAGYGNEGTSTSCPFTPETENHSLTYGELLARSLGAESSTVAWSGKGVVSNYGGNREAPMPSIYDRAEPNDQSSVWDYTLWQPDALLVNLSTNDYSTDNDPEDQEFITAYTNLLATFRNRYPNAQILCTVGPLLEGADLAKAETNIRTAVARRADTGDRRVAFHAMRVPNANPGCDWHPGVATHAAMARDLEPVLRSLVGW